MSDASQAAGGVRGPTWSRERQDNEHTDVVAPQHEADHEHNWAPAHHAHQTPQRAREEAGRPSSPRHPLEECTFSSTTEGTSPLWCWLPTMNTVLGRFNAVFAFALPVLALLTFLCFATVALKTRTLDNVRVSAAPRIQL